MTRSESIGKLFETYGANPESKRARHYLEAVRGFSEVVVDAGTTRCIERWPHGSLPGAGLLLQCCRAVEAEDRAHRKERRSPEQLGLQRMTDADRDLCRLIRECHREGLGWCERDGRWVASGEDVRVGEGKPYRAPTAIDCERALSAVMCGELVGNPEVVAFWRGEKKAPKSASGMTPLVGDLARQAEVFD